MASFVKHICIVGIEQNGFDTYMAYVTYVTSSDGNNKESQFPECFRDCFLNQKCSKLTQIWLNNE